MAEYDPRSSRRYKTARKAYIAGHETGSPCCLCGQPIDTTLPGTHPFGPTIEHHIPIRTLRVMAKDRAEFELLACDLGTWGLAHARCQRRQGGTVSVTAINARRTPSRW